MKRKQQIEEGHGAFDLMEESFHLLRSAPRSMLVAYYTGTIPFVLGLLYFWSDMSQSAFARERLGTASLGMAVLFFWAKTWQSLFARRLFLQRSAGGEGPGSSTGTWGGMREIFHLSCVQALIHATGLFIWPMALGLLLPFGWVNGFYQSATVLGIGDDASLKGTVKQAAGQAQLWVLQNHVFLLVWKGFWLFAFLNCMTAAVALPYLAKVFFGIESPFTKSPVAMFNTTFFAVMAALVYLATDPLHKAVYVLRCFYGQSLRTGRDLRAELAELGAAGRLERVAALTVVGGILTFGAPGIANAREPGAPPPAKHEAVEPAHLDKSITEVLQQPEYSWRLPRPEKSREVGLFEGFVASIGDTIASWVKSSGRWVGKVLDKLIGWLRPSGGFGSAGVGWVVAVRTIAFVLLVVLVFFIAVFLFRLWQGRRPALDRAVAAAPQGLPDLNDHDVAADQLPEDEWLKLARDLLQGGELRLAMRAFYLATLAHLAARNLITLAKYKSNYEYGRELQRRAHALPAITRLFDENVVAFDRTWYGLHDVDRGALDRFASNVETIKCA